jgi:hypothetical protein
MQQEIAGIIPDVSGNGNDGALVGGTMQGRDGLTFDGATGYVNVGDAGKTLTDTQTIVVRFKTETGNKRIVSRTDVLSGGDYYIDSIGRLVFQNSSGAFVSDSTDYRDGRTHFSALSFNNDSLQFFVDGGAVGSTRAVTMLAASGDTLIAARSIGNNFNGTIHNAAIYNKAKSPEWILQEFNRARNMR